MQFTLSNQSRPNPSCPFRMPKLCTASCADVLALYRKVKEICAESFVRIVVCMIRKGGAVRPFVL